jgi:uncharacterized membrane protein
VNEDILSEGVQAAADGPKDEKLPGVSRFQLAALALMVVASAIVYPSLPARIPMHWNVYGQIDDWAPKSLWSVFFPAVIIVGLMVLAWAMPRIDPFKKSYLKFRGAYHLVIDLIVGFLAFLQGVTLYAAFRTTVPVGVIAPVGVGLLLAAVGNQLPKVKRNFYMGIRTPWTIASDKVWVRTHRVGARVFVAGGLASAVAGFLPAPLNFVIFMAIVLSMMLGVVVYSYVLYHDLERRGELDGPGGETLGQ